MKNNKMAQAKRKLEDDMKKQRAAKSAARSAQEQTAMNKLMAGAEILANRNRTRDSAVREIAQKKRQTSEAYRRHYEDQSMTERAVKGAIELLSEQRAQARRDAARMLLGAASRGAGEAAKQAAQRVDRGRRAFASMGDMPEREMPHQMGTAATPAEQMRQRLVADVNATGRLPAGYGWYGTGENAVAADQRGLVYKPLEDVTAGSKAATPAVYGIDPDSYLAHMQDYDAWEAERDKLPEAAKRAQDYLQPAIDAESDPARKAALQEQLDTAMANAQYSPAEQRRRKKLENKAMAATNVLGEDIGQYAGRSDADYLRSYAQQYGIEQEGEKYGESYRAPVFQRKGSDTAEHADLMNKLRFGEKHGAINPVDILETGDTQMLQNLSDDEAAAYMGMASRYGADTAQAYWNALKQEGQYGQKAYAVRDVALRDMAGSGLLGAAGSSALSVMTSPMSLAGTLYSVTQKLTGKEIDPYADQFMFGQMTGTLRDEVGRSITRQYGKEDGTDTFASWLMKTGYNAAMSSADSLMAGQLSGGSALGGSVLLGSSGAGSVIQDAKLRGGSDEQALALGGLSVVFETATEYLPMDTLLNTIDGKDIRTFRDVLGSALKGGLSEAPGEGLSELLSHVSDQALMGPMSNYNLHVAQYEQTGMSSEEAHTQAKKDLMWDVFNAAATGFLSGEGSNLLAGGNALFYNRMQTEDQQLQMQPMEDPLAAAANELAAKQEQKAAAEAAVPEIQEDEEGVSRFDRPMAATVIDQENGNVQVIGFETTQDGKNMVLHTMDEAGNRGTAMVNELAFANETVQDLMTADGAKNLSGEGLQSYLTGYTQTVNGKSVTPAEYAQAYGMVYRRAAAGMDMADAIRNSVIPQVMTQSAMQDAYAAGLGAGAVTQQTTPLSPTPTATAKGVMNRSFTTGAWNSMTRQQQRIAAANMEVVSTLAKRMGATINIVDSITDGAGNRANGRYNAKTGQIDIALNADANAYAYVAMHELTHQLKDQHSDSWSTFSGWVQEALTDKGQDFEKLVKYQMDSFGLSREDAAEEVICNTVPAMLQDEGTLQKLYEQDRTLFEKLMDWLKNLISDVKAAGKVLSERSQSWKQMGALKEDAATLQGLYDVMESIMQGEKESGGNDTKHSPLEGYTEEGIAVYSSNFPQGSTRKERQDHILELVQNVWAKKPIRLFIAQNGKQKEILAQFDPTIDYEGETYTDATKLAYGNRKGSTPDQKVTEKLADDFPELIGTASYAHSKAESGGKNEAHNGVLVWHYFANHIGFVHESGSYAEYNVFIDVKQKDNGHFVYAVEAEKIKGSERPKAPTLYSDPKTLLASGSGIAPTIADNIILGDQGNVKYSYAGQTAKTADHDMLATARDMRDDGVDNETIRKETGWFVGKDGKWRFEMDDSQSRVKLPESNYNELGDLLENSRILEAYPEMANMKVIFQGLEDGQYGQYDAKFDTIDLSYELKTKPKELRYALLHELQHAIQHRERFATGASVAYWQRRIDEGFDTRTAKQKEAEAKAEEALRRVMEEKPEFYHDMMNLRKMLPDVPRGKVDWDTLEQLEDDPVEWQKYDAQRDLLEEKYGVEAMFDFDDLLHDREKAMRSERSATDLYFATAGEIEARNVEGRADLTAEERREKAPVLGDEDTVFARTSAYNATDAAHTPEQLRIMQEYADATDKRLLEAVSLYASNKYAPNKRLKICDVNQRMAEDVRRLLGIDVQGYTVNIDRSGLNHILKRHGKKGEHDHSMSNSADIARMGYVIENYDHIEILKNQNGEPVYSSSRINREGKPSPVLLLRKRIDGEYYLSEAIVDSSWKKIWVQSAYIKKAGDYATAENGNAPQLTSETPNASLSDNNSIAQNNRVDNAKFSLSDYDDTVREGENVLEELLTMTAAHRMTDAEAARVARKVLKAASSEMELEEATQRIKSIFDYASRSGDKLDMYGLSSEATALADDMLSQSKTLDMQHEEEVADLRYYLKHNQISLSTEQQKEAANLMGGSYSAYRKALFGRVNLNRNGSALDGAVWEQLHEAAPHLFPLDATSGDQVRLLMEAAEYVQPVYHNESGLDAREAAQWLTHELFNAYMSLSGVQSAAKEQNRLGLKLRQYRQVAERFAKEHKAAFDEAYAKVTKEAGAQIAAATEKAERRADKAISEAEADADLRVAKAQAGVAERIADAKQQNLADMEAYREAMREKAKTWRSEFVTRHRDVERKNRYRAQILRETNQLLKKVEKPTDTHHVQDELTGALTTFLKSLDLGRRSKERSIGDRILSLRNVMQDAANGEGGRSFLVDSDILESMRFMAEQLQGMDSLDQLTADQMEQVRNIVHCAVWTVNKADTTFADRKTVRISAAAGRFLMEAEKRQDVKDRGDALNKARDFLTVGQMDSMHFFDKLGGAAKEMYQSLRDGLDKKTMHRAHAMDYVAEAVSKIPEKARADLFAGKKAAKTRYELTGGSIELTKAQVMEIYCLNKREQARGHLYDESVGGIRTGDNQNARSVKVQPKDIDKLTDTLTVQEKALADALQQYMVNECAKWGNETSMVLYGYKKFGEANYYPIRVDPDSVGSNNSQEGQQDNLYAIANMGMTKALKEKAKNALYIGDIFDTFCRHVDNMATYNAYAAPIADLVRWYNYRPGDGSSVKKMIQTKWGKEAAEYIPRLIRDLNGEVNRSYSPKWDEKMTGLMKSSSVGRNVRVAIQQPTAILRAGDMMDYRYITAGLTGLTGKGGKVKLKDAIELSKQHCPIALLKSMGFFETDMGKSLRAAMFDNRGVLDKIKDEGMWLPGKMDEMTFGTIWRACEAETRKLKPELAVGSDAYYEAVGKRMSEIIDYTQVVDTPFHRTQLMRSSDGLTKMATSFMSEPSKTYNMLASAMQRLKENRHDPVAKRKFCRALGAFGLNAVVNAAAQSLIDAMRDGEDEEFWAKWGKAMFGDWSSCEKFMDYVRTALDANSISGLNPLSLIPYIKDVLSMVQGYDVKRTDMQSMEKLMQVGTNVGNLINGKNKLSGWGWARQIATAVDSVTGQSFGNALRDGYSFANMILKAIGLDPISEKTEVASTSIAYDNLYDAMLDGDAKKWSRVSKQTGTTLKKTEKEIDAAMATHFAEDAAEQVVTAYTAKQEGKASEYNRIRSRFVDEYGEVLGENGSKRAEEIFDKSVAVYANDQESEEEEVTASTPLNSKAWSYTEAASVVQGYANGTCSKEDIALVRSEMIADSTAKNPQTTVDTSILKQVKKLYIAAGPAERKRLGEAVKELFGKDDKYLANWLK
ncbi:MAG: hypothetical protein J6K73_04945 [Clostridia bacterium]|nr:hypothetical protein [Clostridia bacterium]